MTSQAATVAVGDISKIGVKGNNDDANDDSKGADGPMNEMMSYCKDDIDNYCASSRGRGGLVILYCLEKNKQKLSSSCQEYLGSAVVGGCNVDAVLYCSDKYNIDDIYNCLNDHKSKLSETCLNNLKSQSSPWDSLATRSKNITSAITSISMLYLLIPCLIALLSYYMNHKLNKQQKEVMNEHSNVSPRSDASTNETLTSAAQGATPWHISFSNISYSIDNKCILKDINGEFLPRNITAIMGPSGSGKTTLLKLLGGHINTGEFHGDRCINGKPIAGKKYDELIRRQGYVAQENVLLESLTVWQTMYYSAILRINSNVGMKEKLKQAAKIMDEMGLYDVKDTIVGSGERGISGGQRRRLSIALELLSNPEILLLDEPTSGLDSSSSMKLVQLLRRMTRFGDRGTTVALTIHQPRAEVFALFDSILLLGSGGYLLYYGRTSAAASHLAAAPCAFRSLDNYDNEADFIIDVLDSAETDVNNTDIEMSSSASSPTRDDDNIELTLLPSGARPVAEAQDLLNTNSNKNYMIELNKHFVSSSHYSDLMESINGHNSNSNEVLLQRVPVTPFNQIWLLFSRRVQLHLLPKNSVAKDILYPLLEITFVTSIVTYAFSYPIDLSLELPYQTLMLFFMISTYAMILQYLILIPEYMLERKVLQREKTSGVVDYIPYIVSTMLTEMPRAVIQCILLVSLLYFIHPNLNPDPINIRFCYVCLMVGTCAWQSLICVISVITDDAGFAYTLSFLTLGSGTLFGGLMVRINKIPQFLKFIYYSSVVAVTQRTLVVNDLQCCYMTTNCFSLYHEFTDEYKNQSDMGVASPPRLMLAQNSSGILNPALLMCPPGLQITGDGSDKGNLGRFYLRILGLDQDNPFLSLLLLFWANVLLRFIAILILYLRDYLKYKLVKR